MFLWVARTDGWLQLASNAYVITVQLIDDYHSIPANQVTKMAVIMQSILRAFFSACYNFRSVRGPMSIGRVVNFHTSVCKFGKNIENGNDESGRIVIKQQVFFREQNSHRKLCQNYFIYHKYTKNPKNYGLLRKFFRFLQLFFSKKLNVGSYVSYM